MKKGMCRGCDNLGEKVQTQFYEDDNFTEIKPPRKIKKPFCQDPGGYGLHIEYVEWIHTGEDICVRYCHEGIS